MLFSLGLGLLLVPLCCKDDLWYGGYNPGSASRSTEKNKSLTLTKTLNVNLFSVWKIIDNSPN